MHTALAKALESCQPLLPDSFRSGHQRLFHGEHLEKLAKRLWEFHHEGVPDSFPPPHLDVEYTPPLAEVFQSFSEALDLWLRSEDRNSWQSLRLLADALAASTCKNILIVLGQRLTPGSLTDTRAIPRPTNELLEASAQIHSGKLSVGARALTKHLQRNEEAFWGDLRGSEDQKTETAQTLIQSVLQGATWWNVFVHYKHDVVYEARVPEGYGARWGNDGRRFIGFLEPFTPGFPHVRD